MTAAEPAPAARRRVPWLKLALVASLALNMLFLGAAAARFFVGGPEGRVSGISQAQLIPRKFFSELEMNRRRELLQVVKEFGPAFRAGRTAAREGALGLAAALEAEPYDEARVKAAVGAFSAKSTSLVGTGGEAALALIARLDAEERKLLAKHIRLREEKGRGEGRRKREGG
ncbi:periplasmic heavy metal sensor [Aestuariivirga sp.]|uniref:periplasmic heavy metal sensor n=1 Tax=Aestuariivirga sp. TaxID=2650926 RepID=UPI00391B02CA